MIPINNLRELETVHKEIREVFKFVGTKVDDASFVDDFNIFDSIDTREERDLLEKTIDNVINDSAIHVVKLKTRLNALVPINRLPAEVFCLIILFTQSPTFNKPDPYLRYTWVCNHWRMTLIRDCRLWNFIKPRSRGLGEVFDELIRRSKSAKLDVIVPCLYAECSTTKIESFLASASNRIRTLFITSYTLKRFNSPNWNFSSLQHLILSDYTHGPNHQYIILLSALAAAENLKTFECEITEEAINVDQLAPVFNRITKLRIGIRSSSHSFIHSILALLHNTKLQALSIWTDEALNFDTDKVIMFPELQTLRSYPLLSQRIRAPKLSYLDAISNSIPGILFENFGPHFPLIKYLYVRNDCGVGHQTHSEYRRCIIAWTQPPTCPTNDRDKKTFGSVFDEQRQRQYFHIRPDVYLKNRLQPTLLKALSRSINLVELHLLVHNELYDLQKVLIKAPSIKKLTINQGDKLPYFIQVFNDDTMLPNLKELIHSPVSKPRSLEKYAEEIGRTLTECLKSRKESCVHQLQSITLGNCPALPESWLKELERLGTTVMTDNYLPKSKQKS